MNIGPIILADWYCLTSLMLLMSACLYWFLISKMFWKLGQSEKHYMNLLELPPASSVAKHQICIWIRISKKINKNKTKKTDMILIRSKKSDLGHCCLQCECSLFTDPVLPGKRLPRCALTTTKCGLNICSVIITHCMELCIWSNCSLKSSVQFSSSAADDFKSRATEHWEQKCWSVPVEFHIYV